MDILLNGAIQKAKKQKQPKCPLPNAAIFNLFLTLWHTNQLLEYVTHQQYTFYHSDQRIGKILIHSHWTAIVVLAVVIFLFHNPREKKSVSLRKQSVIACFKNEFLFYQQHVKKILATHWSKVTDILQSFNMDVVLQNRKSSSTQRQQNQTLDNENCWTLEKYQLSYYEWRHPEELEANAYKPKFPNGFQVADCTRPNHRTPWIRGLGSC